jgi:hypothetical protein
MIRRHNRIVILLLITAVMLACVPTLGTPVPPVPTFDPNAINTVIVETANAAFTQTALFTTPSSTPTATPPFTSTPTETPTTVPTILIVLVTPTVPTPIPQVNSGTDDKFNCTVLSKSPNDGFGFSAGIEFTVTWQVLNTGQEVWDAASADIRYLSGARIYVQSAYDLESNVPPNEQYTVTVKMKAPLESGTYTTAWAIRTQAVEYCRMSISIKV